MAEEIQKIVVDVDAQEAIAEADRLNKTIAKGEQAYEKVGKAAEAAGGVQVRVSDRTAASSRRFLENLEKKMAMSGASPIQQRMIEWEQTMKRFEGDPAKQARTTELYDKEIKRLELEEKLNAVKKQSAIDEKHAAEAARVHAAAQAELDKQAKAAAETLRKENEAAERLAATQRRTAQNIARQTSQRFAGSEVERLRLEKVYALSEAKAGGTKAELKAIAQGFDKAIAEALQAEADAAKKVTETMRRTVDNILARTKYQAASAVERLQLQRGEAIRDIKKIDPGNVAVLAEINKHFDKLIANQEKSDKVAQRKQLASQLRENADAADHFANRMIAAGVAIGGVLTYLTKIAGQLEQTRLSFEVLLGGKPAGEAFFKSIEQYSKQSIYSLDQLARSAQRALALGFGPEQALKVVKAANAVSAAMGGGAEQADRITLALGQMQAKQKVSAEEMRQLSEAGVQAWKALADAAGTDVPTAMKMAEKGMFDASIAVRALTDAILEGPLGAMEERVRTQTLTGRIAALRTEVIGLAQDFEGELVPKGKSLLDTFKGLIQSARELVKWYLELPPEVKDLITTFAQLAIAATLLAKALGGIERAAAFLIGGAGISGGIASLLRVFGAGEAAALTWATRLGWVGVAIAAVWTAYKAGEATINYIDRKNEESHQADIKRYKEKVAMENFLQDKLKERAGLLPPALPDDDFSPTGAMAKSGRYPGLVRAGQADEAERKAAIKRQRELEEQALHIRMAAEAKAASEMEEIGLRYEERRRQFAHDGTLTRTIEANLEAAKIAEINKLLTKRHEEENKKRIEASKDAYREGLQDLQQGAKDLDQWFDKVAKERADHWAELSRITTENEMNRYTVQQTQADVDRARAQAELAGKEVGDLTVRQKLDIEKRRLAIDEEYARKSLDIQRRKLEAQRNAELATIPGYAQYLEQRNEIEAAYAPQIFEAEQAGLREHVAFLKAERDKELNAAAGSDVISAQRRIAIQEKYNAQIEALVLQTDNDISQQKIENATRSNQIIYDDYRETFNKIKDAASSLLDQLFSRTKSWGDLVKSILKTAVLAPLKEIAATWIAMMWTGSAPGGKSGGGGTGGGGGGSWLGNLARIFGGGGGGQGGGGFGWPGNNTGIIWNAVPKQGSGSGAVNLGGYFGSFGANAGGGGGGAATQAAAGGWRGILGNLGFGGLTGGQGAGGGFMGLLKGLGNLGRNMDVLGNKMGSIPGTAGAKLPGVGGALGGAMLLGGGALVAYGMYKGGVKGLISTTAGGALIGAKFGGPLGAAIGAGVGFAAGSIRMMFKGAKEKMKEKIKSIYGVTITSNGILDQIMQIVKQNYGGDMNVGLYAAPVRELIQMYAMTQGSTAANMPRPMYGVSWDATGGQNALQPVYSNGAVVATPYTGTTTANVTPGSNTFVQLDPRQANDLFEGRVVQVVSNNAPVVADAASSSSMSADYRRSSQRNALIEPLTMMA